MEKQRLSFAEISKRMRELDLPSFDIIIGIGKGGIVPASMIAHQLRRDLKVINLNYRDNQNYPRYDEPQITRDVDELTSISGSVLLVDDVSVSGKTMLKAKSLLPNCQIATLVCKGKADFVLFPEVSSCVDWPWKSSSAVEVEDSI